MHRIIECAYCGTNFVSYHSRQKYCSDYCRQRDYWRKNREDILERQKVYRMTGKYPRKKK